MKPTKPPKPHFPPLPGAGRSIGQMPGQRQFGTLNPQGFEELLRQNGVRMRISKIMPCPKVRDVRGQDHSPDCDACRNGWVYFGEQEFIGAFAGNSNSRSFPPQGTLDFDTAQIVVPTADERGRPLHVSFFDRIEADITPIRYYQRVQTTGNVDRLQLRAVRVEKLVGYDGAEYIQGQDFVLDPHGRVEWTGERRPGFDPMRGVGEVYSIVYYVSPSYTVMNIPSQTRNSQVEGPQGPGNPNAQARFPQVVVVRREIISEDPANKPRNED